MALLVAGPAYSERTVHIGACCRFPANDPPTDPTRGSRKLLVIGRGPVDRGHRDFVEPEVDGQLTAVMREMHHRVAQNDLARLFTDDIARDNEAPGFLQVVLGRAPKRLARFRDTFVERLDQLG